MSSEADTVSDDAVPDGSAAADTVPDEPEAGVHAGISVPAPVAQVWEHLITQSGTEELLGDGARLGNKGEPWHAADGSFGVVRSFHPMEQVRVTWHPHEGGPLSMLDVQLRPEGDSTRVEVYHEGKGIAGDPRGDWQHWQDALQRFSSGLQ